MRLNTIGKVVILAVGLPALTYFGIAMWVYFVRLAVETGK